MATHPDIRQPFRILDSPWFWALAFSFMALVATALVAPKYAVRQQQIEGRFLGRQQAAIERSRRAAGLPPVDLSEEARDRDVAQPRRIVPLWTLSTAAAVAAIGCGVMLRREWRYAQENMARSEDKKPPAGAGGHRE
jgi:hypothetical protein